MFLNYTTLIDSIQKKRSSSRRPPQPILNRKIKPTALRKKTKQTNKQAVFFQQWEMDISRFGFSATATSFHWHNPCSSASPTCVRSVCAGRRCPLLLPAVGMCKCIGLPTNKKHWGFVLESEVHKSSSTGAKRHWCGLLLLPACQPCTMHHCFHNRGLHKRSVRVDGVHGGGVTNRAIGYCRTCHKHPKKLKGFLCALPWNVWYQMLPWPRSQDQVRGLTWFSKSCIQLKQLEDGERKLIIIRFKK